MRKGVIVALGIILLILIGCQNINPQAAKPKGLTTIPLDKIATGPVEPELEQDILPQITASATAEVVPSNVPDKDFFVITVNETQMVKPKLSAADPDGDPVKYYFYAPLNERGEWLTKLGDRGEYKTKIVASDGKINSTLYLKIVINKFNQAPILETIEDITLSEGDTVIINPKAIDPNNDEVEIKISGWMNSKLYKTNYNDAGTHLVTVTASDGMYSTAQDVTVKINNVNRAPQLQAIDNVEVTEGDLVKVSLKATDPDNDPIKVTVFGPVSDAGEWQTKIGDKGTYTIKVTASDAHASAETSFTVIVLPKDKMPVLEPIADVTVDEGQIAEILVKATDPEGKELVYKASDKNFMQERNLFRWQTDYDDGNPDQAVYNVKITVTDGVNEVSQDVKVTVRNVNRAPCWITECPEED
ncbi:Ig-like domain-containing protein [Candidatus Woesearchaeota archaeon]|nr:Ig-like domain-containing protein [Candidatus Woesearchaeota archaeon]